MNEIIKIEKNENNELVTDSRNVADVTSKQHKHVMDIIRKMINDRPEIDGSRFRPIYYIDQFRSGSSVNNPANNRPLRDPKVASGVI